MLAQKEIEAIGTRSSRDAFFSRKKGTDVDPSTISRGNVKKAAYTNCIGNGVTRLLGIRNMTWEELEQAGIRKGQTASVDRSGVPRAPKFGKYNNHPLTEVPDEWLDKYATTLVNSIEDPSKSRYKSSNEKLLEHILQEVDQRKLNAQHAEVSEPEVKNDAGE